MIVVPVFLLMLMMVVSPAVASDPPVSRSLVITPVDKCYEQIGAAAAHEVRTQFARPYEECMRRLDEKLKQEQVEKAKADAAAAHVDPPSPKNYYRVQKTPRAAE